MVRCPKLKWFWMRHFRHPFCFWRSAKLRRCDVHGLRQRWCGNMVHSEEGRWLLAVGDGLSLHGKETWSQYRLCVDRTTSEWTWMYEKWTVGQSGDYAKLMVGDGIILWLARAHCDMWMCVSCRRRHEVQWLNQVLEEFNETSPQGYNTSWPTVISDENEMKASAKMCYTYDARDVVNLWRP